MNHASLKCCIFDLDGVICDTAKYHYLAWKKLADILHIPFNETDNERLKGVSRMDSLRILISLGTVSYSEQELLHFAELKNEWYRNYISQISSNEILNGVLDFILELRNHNIKIALGSVSKNATDILNNLGIEQYFDVIIDGNKVTNAKPAPDVFLAGAQELHLAPDFCIVFEDAVSGVEAAHNAHMKCIGIGTPDILTEAEHVIPGFADFTYQKLIELPL